MINLKNDVYLKRSLNNIFNRKDGLHYHQKHNLLKFYLVLM